MSGTLFICATPIGNLEDISLRCLRILKEADLIAAEDTRHSLKLLNFYGIKNELISYHEHNKNVRDPKLIESLKHGKNIALITDAGMPLIQDPGCTLVSLCRSENIAVTVVPGASAFSAALVLSGMDLSCFTFFGFLPRDKSKKIKTAEAMKTCCGTIVIYEAPHHLASTLKFLEQALSDRNISVVREITKIHEEVKAATLSEAAEFYTLNHPKGEFVIVIENKPESKTESSGRSKMPVAEHVSSYISEGFAKKEAMKLAARDRGVSKSEIYKEFCNTGKELL